MISEDGYGPEAWMRAVARMILRFLLCAAIIVGAVYVLGRLRLVIVYLVVAAIFAYIMRPMAGWLARKRWFTLFHERLISLFRLGRPTHLPFHVRRVIATLYVLVLIFIGGGYALERMLEPFVNQVTLVTQNWETEYKPQFEKYTADLKGWYTTHVRKEWRDKIEQSFKQSSADGDLGKQAAAIGGETAKKAGEYAHQIVEIVLLPVLAFYFALDSKKIKHEFVGLLPARRRREVARMIHEFNEIMHSFVIGQAILCTLAGVVIWLFLLALRVPFALTLGLLAGFTRAIPIIGPILGGIPIVLLTLVTAGLPQALSVLAFFTFLHFAESKFVMPMLIGERMNLHPVVIIIVLLIGQEFGGLLGMFFAAPITALLRVIVRRYWLKNHPRKAAPLRLPVAMKTPGAVD